MQGAPPIQYWCGRGDSNPHGIATASPSSWCVCQFRHFREEGHVFSGACAVPRYFAVAAGCEPASGGVGAGAGAAPAPASGPPRRRRASASRDRAAR